MKFSLQQLTNKTKEQSTDDYRAAVRSLRDAFTAKSGEYSIAECVLLKTIQLTTHEPERISFSDLNAQGEPVENMLAALKVLTKDESLLNTGIVKPEFVIDEEILFDQEERAEVKGAGYSIKMAIKRHAELSDGDGIYFDIQSSVKNAIKVHDAVQGL